MPNRLQDKVIIVTGASRGLGQYMALGMAAEGAKVVVAARTEQTEHAILTGTIYETAQQIEAAGGVALPVRCNVADPASIEAMVEATLARFGRIDVLVNNAGIDVIEPFVESKEETWRRIVEVNYLGPVVCTRAVLDGMIERGYGRIISMSSDAGKVGSSGEVVYSGTKGGIIAFSKALAREVAAKGITVNCVCPGPTDTPLLDQIAERSQKMYDALAKAVPMRRLGQPADIAPAVVFLASDGAAFITGQALSVSGGLTMS